MSFEHCLVKLKEFLKEQGLEKEVRADRVARFAQQLELASAESLTPAEFGVKVNDLIAAEELKINKASQLQELIYLNHKHKTLENLGQTVELRSPENKNSAKAWFGALRDFIQGGGIEKSIGGNLDKIEMARAFESKLRRKVRLGIDDIKEKAYSGVLDKDAWFIVDALDKGLPLDNFKNKVEALKLAHVLKAWRDDILKARQAYSPYLEKADEYLFKQFHDRDEIIKVGKEAWVDRMMELASKKSFPYETLETKRSIFEDIYKEIEADRFGTVASDEPNISKRMAAHRNIIFDDAEAAWKYQEQFGPESLMAGMDRTTSKAAHDMAMVAKFTSTPKQMFRDLLEHAHSQLTGDEAKKFHSQVKQLEKMFRVVSTGAQSAPAESLAAKAVQSAMTWQYLGKVGSGWLRSFQDVQMLTTLLRNFNGKNFFENAFDVIGTYSKAMVSNEFRKQGLENMGLFVESAHREMLRSIGVATKGQEGWAAKAIETLGSLNVLNRHTEAMKSATGHLFAKMAGDMSEKDFASLGKRFQNGLLRYDIGDLEWNVIRGGRETILGRQMLTPEGVLDLPDEVFSKYLRDSGQFKGKGEPTTRLIDKARYDLSNKLGTLLNEHADLASSTPTTRQKTFLFGDTDINSMEGIMRRMMTQFKSASVVGYDMYRRSYYSGEGLKGDYSGVAQHALGMMMFWTMGEYLKQLASGKTPEDPRSVEFAVKAIAGSGAGGILADIISNQVRQEGVQGKIMGAGSAILGPTLGTAIEGGALVSQMIADKYNKGKVGKGTKARAAGYALSNLPVTSSLESLFYTKAAFNYYIMDRLKEHYNTGHIRNLQKRDRERGQTSWIGYPR